MNKNWKTFNRKLHYWGSLSCALPVLIIIVTGIILLLKKDFNWIQPQTAQGVTTTPELSFEHILRVAQSVPEAEISDWSDINRLDVRPNKGITKIRSNNHWEIQVDNFNSDILQVAYRRSDIIEAIHDGSFFHSMFSRWIFLPAGILLLFLWVTGLVLFLLPFVRRRQKIRKPKRFKQAKGAHRQLASNRL